MVGGFHMWNTNPISSIHPFRKKVLSDGLTIFDQIFFLISL